MSIEATFMSKNVKIESDHKVEDDYMNVMD